MRDAGGKLAYGFELVRLLELGFQLLCFSR